MIDISTKTTSKPPASHSQAGKPAAGIGKQGVLAIDAIVFLARSLYGHKDVVEHVGKKKKTNISARWSMVYGMTWRPKGQRGMERVHTRSMERAQVAKTIIVGLRWWVGFN